MSDLGFGAVYPYFDPPDDLGLEGVEKLLINGKMVKDVVPSEPIKISKVGFTKTGEQSGYLEIELVKDGETREIIYRGVTSITIRPCMINGFFTDVGFKTVFKTEPIDLDYMRIFSDGSVFIYLKNCTRGENP